MKDDDILILTPDDYFLDSRGNPVINSAAGGSRMLYQKSVVIALNRDKSYRVLKDRYELSESEIKNLITPVDNNKLLLLIN